MEAFLSGMDSTFTYLFLMLSALFNLFVTTPLLMGFFALVILRGVVKIFSILRGQ